MTTFDRRNFLKALTAGAAFGAMPSAFKLYAAPQDYSGKLLITIQAAGGYDVTAFCDPKINVVGERPISNWSESQSVQQAGNIKYAPVAGNQTFFDKHYQNMLVINGVDAQTNSHTAGETHNWSGRISSGYPTLTALFSSIQAPDLPISYINNGGYAETASLIRYTRLNSPGQLRNVIYPNRVSWDLSQSYLHPSDWARVVSARDARLQRLVGEAGKTAQQTANRSGFKSALDNSAVLTDFASTLAGADTFEQPISQGDYYSDLRRQAQIALLAMQSGVSVSADLIQHGFDSHADNDVEQFWYLERLTQGIDYLWEYAEQLGLSDRLIVVLSSDFGRTPWYNDDNGKDHWPVSSTIIMERNVNWGNRVIGGTDEGQNVVPTDPVTLQQSISGETIYPKHVMYNLRRYLGIEQEAATQLFPLGSASAFDFFSV